MTALAELRRYWVARRLCPIAQTYADSESIHLAWNPEMVFLTESRDQVAAFDREIKGSAIFGVCGPGTSGE